MPYTNLSAVLSPADKAAIMTNLQNIRSILSFAVNLTAEERRALPKMGDKRFTFVTKVMEYTVNEPQFNPPYLSLPEANKDLNLFNDLRALLAESQQVTEIMSDTQMASGVEIYDYCRAYYDTVKEASVRNAPGAESIFQDLNEFFDRPPQEEDGEPPPPPPPPPDPVPTA